MIDPQQAKIAGQWKHAAPLISCRFDPLGRYLISCSEDFTLQRWKLDDGQETVMSGHESWPRGLAWTPDGQLLISGGCDEQLIWWSVDGEQPSVVRKQQAHQGWIRTLAISRDGRLLASGGNDQLARLWNVADGSLVRELKGHQMQVYSSAFDAAGEFLVTGDLGGTVHQWEVSTGKLVRSYEAPALHSYNKGQGVNYGGVRSLAFSPDGSRLACSGLHKATNPLGAVNEPLVVVFDCESGKIVRSHVASGVRGIGWRTVYHPDGLLIGVSGGSGGGYLIFWKPDADEAVHKLKLPNTAREMDLSPDGSWVATAHHDGHVRRIQLAG